MDCNQIDVAARIANGEAPVKTCLREVRREDVTFTVKAEQDDIPVRGYFASGDDEADRREEEEIIRRLNEGDVWAWASVAVTASWRGFSATTYLGGCSYADEKDFRQPGWYFDDMCEETLGELRQKVAEAHAAVCTHG